MNSSTDTVDADDMPMSDKDLLAEVVMALVDKPALVRVEEQYGESSSTLIIHCDPSDRGKVIGKEGKTMTAVRILFGRIAAVKGRKTFIQVDNSLPANERRPTRPTPRTD